MDGHDPAPQGRARPGRAGGGRRARRVRLRRGAAAAGGRAGRRGGRLGVRDAAPALCRRAPDLLCGAVGGGAAPQVLRDQRRRAGPAGRLDRDLAVVHRRHGQAAGGRGGGGGVNDTIDGEVARDATAVRAAFADLPAPERELLLEDLEDHLEEVAAEDGGPLAERLGPPEGYAAELRASAGLPAPGAAGRRATLRESRLARRLEGAWRAARAHPAGRAGVEFLPELRPAWWVVRGYLAVQAAAVALTRCSPAAGCGSRSPSCSAAGCWACWPPRPRWSGRWAWAAGPRAASAGAP